MLFVFELPTDVRGKRRPPLLRVLFIEGPPTEVLQRGIGMFPPQRPERFAIHRGILYPQAPTSSRFRVHGPL